MESKLAKQCKKELSASERTLKKKQEEALSAQADELQATCDSGIDKANTSSRLRCKKEKDELKSTMMSKCESKTKEGRTMVGQLRASME